MKDYNTYTNSELEDELDNLKKQYESAQNIVLENYTIMMDLASNYSVVKDIIDTRTGRKKEG